MGILAVTAKLEWLSVAMAHCRIDIGVLKERVDLFRDGFSCAAILSRQSGWFHGFR